MAKQVVRVGGEDKTVREDTAKSYRGVMWILTLVGLMFIIWAIMFFGGLLGALSGGETQNPAQIEEKRR